MAAVDALSEDKPLSSTITRDEGDLAGSLMVGAHTCARKALKTNGAQIRTEAVVVPETAPAVKRNEDLGVDARHDQDHRAILERNEEIGRQILSGELKRNVYRGQKAYAPIISKREGALAANKYTGAYGPLRASGAAYTRITTRMDYNPELCKDYNETGYCGFGDTCKFIHDRYDYKAGWQLENEWEKAQKIKRDQFKAKLAGIKPNAKDDSDSNYED